MFPQVSVAVEQVNVLDREMAQAVPTSYLRMELLWKWKAHLHTVVAASLKLHQLILELDSALFEENEHQSFGELEDTQHFLAQVECIENMDIVQDLRSFQLDLDTFVDNEVFHMDCNSSDEKCFLKSTKKTHKCDREKRLVGMHIEQVEGRPLQHCKKTLPSEGLQEESPIF